MRLRLTLFLAALALSAAASFADVSVNGLNFALSADGTASLTGAATLPDTLRIPSSITSGGITYSVTSVGKKAFKSKGTVKEIIVPASVQRIENDAFSYMGDLEGVTIEDAANELYFGFQDGTFLDDEMFYSCDKIAHAYIGRNLTWNSDKEGPFQTRKALTKVVFGPLVTRVGCGYAEKKELFDDCTAIKQVVFKGSSTSGPLALMTSTGLSVATVFSIDRELTNGLTDSDTGALQKMLANAVSVTLGQQLSYLHTAMFQGCKALTNITVPQNVAEIRRQAFAGCTGLRYIVLRGTPTIGSQAFAGCTAIKRVCIDYDTAPEGDTSAGTDCFDATTYASATLQNVGHWKGTFDVLPWREFKTNYVAEPRILKLDTETDSDIAGGSYDQIQIACNLAAETWSLLSLPMLVDSYYFGADADVFVADTLIADSPFRSTLRLKAYDIDANAFMPIDQPFFLRSRRAESLIQCGTTDDTFKAEALAVPPSVSVPTSDAASPVRFLGTFSAATDDRGRGVKAFGAYFEAGTEVHRIYAELDGLPAPIYGLEPIGGDANDDGEVNTHDVWLTEQCLLGLEPAENIFLDVLRLDETENVSIGTIADIVKTINEQTTTEDQ